MNSQRRPWIRLTLVAVAVAVGLYSAWQRERQDRRAKEISVATPAESQPPLQAPSTDSPPAARDAPDVQVAPPALPTVVAKQTIRDQSGRVVFRGDVDVSQTLERIERGRRLQFSHDGITFENRERRLPRQAAGYYHEYVHPTPGVGGPGPQRIVTGRDGEIYYTPDHYRTFRRLDKER